MPDMIRDGTGKGFLAQVTSENKLRAYSTIENEASFESETKERCYSWTDSYNYAANDTIIWLRNDSSTLNLLIEKIVVSSDTATQVIFHSPENTAPAGTVVTGVNLNRSSNHIADATCYRDETNNVRANVIANAIIQANVPAIFPVDGAIILGYLDCLAVDFVTVGALGMATIRGYFHEVI